MASSGLNSSTVGGIDFITRDRPKGKTTLAAESAFCCRPMRNMASTAFSWSAGRSLPHAAKMLQQRLCIVNRKMTQGFISNRMLIRARIRHQARSNVSQTLRKVFIQYSLASERGSQMQISAEVLISQRGGQLRPAQQRIGELPTLGRRSTGGIADDRGQMTLLYPRLLVRSASAGGRPAASSNRLISERNVPRASQPKISSNSSGRSCSSTIIFATISA